MIENGDGSVFVPASPVWALVRRRQASAADWVLVLMALPTVAVVGTEGEIVCDRDFEDEREGLEQYHESHR